MSGREGIQKVAILVQSGAGEDAQQFIPLRSLLNGNVATNQVINATKTIGGPGLSSGTLNNPNNTGVHIFIDLEVTSGTIDTVTLQVFSAPVGLLPALIRTFRPHTIFPRTGTMQLHRAFIDDTNEVTEQRLAGLLTSQFTIDVNATGTASSTVDVKVNIGLIV